MTTAPASTSSWGLTRISWTPPARGEAAEGGELLIPFAGSICTEIDPSRRRILVDLPEGLKDLNR
jgi:ribosomal 30S subunit maturation factor RimM